MMIKPSIKILLLFIAILCFVQVDDVQAQPVVRGDYPQQDTLIQQNKSKEKKSPKVNVALGTSYMNYGQGGAFNTYVAPSVSLPVTDRFSMSVGIGYSSMFFNSPSESGGQNSAMSYGSLFVSGSYQVNDKLWISGTAYKTFSLSPPAQGSSLNQQYFDFSNQGIRMDAEYKVNDKFRIGVSVEYREQNCPSYFQNGFNNFGGSPFGGSSFGGSSFGGSSFGTGF